MKKGNIFVLDFVTEACDQKSLLLKCELLSCVEKETLIRAPTMDFKLGGLKK